MKTILIYCIVSLIPFAYFDVSDVRIILLLPIFFILLLLLSNKVIVSQDLKFFFIMLFIMYIYYLITMSIEALVSVVFFGLFTYWQILLNKNQIAELNLNKIIKIYVLASLLIALSILVQFLLYKVFNYQFLKISFMANNYRIGYLSIWNDLSYLSLYLASTVPLVLYSVSKKSIKIVIILILLSACILTSARTGIVSLLLFYFISIIYRQSILYIILYGSIIVVLILTLYYFIDIFQLLRFTEGDSGRFMTFIQSLTVMLDSSILTGVMFDRNIPIYAHNFLINLFANAGMLFFVIFLLWGYFTLKRVIKSNNIYIQQSLWINFIGLNFIPSLFSAYFIGFLLSIVFITYRKTY